MCVSVRSQSNLRCGKLSAKTHLTTKAAASASDTNRRITYIKPTSTASRQRLTAAWLGTLNKPRSMACKSSEAWCGKIIWMECFICFSRSPASRSKQHDCSAVTMTFEEYPAPVGFWEKGHLSDVKEQCSASSCMIWASRVKDDAVSQSCSCSFCRNCASESRILRSRLSGTGPTCARRRARSCTDIRSAEA